MQSDALYTLRDVVKQTSISKQTLHAWERRYEVVTPQRTDSNRRLYTHTDIYRLKLLTRLVHSGKRIGNIAQCSIADLESMEMAARPLETGSVTDFIRTIHELDQRSLDRMLTNGFLSAGPGRFVHEIVFPVLREIGRQWGVGTISAASEHLFSASVRNLLGLALNQGPAQTADISALFATISGEAHEIGVLAAAVAAKSNGICVTYLGPQLPAEDIASAATTVGADIVCLGAPTSNPKREQIDGLLRLLPDRTEVWLGGSFETSDVDQHPRLRVFDDLLVFERALRLKAVQAGARESSL